MTPDATAFEARVGQSPAPYRRHLVLLACAWTVAVAGSLAWSFVQIQDEIRSLTSQTARALLEKDLLYREWSILHGGLYVPKPGSPRPDPSPSESADGADLDREVRTPSGRILTLLNPAQVSREIFHSQEDSMGIRGRLTSLRPIREANLPDAWERQALERLAQGGKSELTNEIISTEISQGERYLRMMRPLVTSGSCLQCHEEAGRKAGELRGGISVTIPMNRFATPGEMRNVTLAHLGLWLMGLTGLSLGVRDLERQALARRRAESERERVIGELEQALAEVKTLSGMIPICASCKKIRDDRGYWTQIETYLQQHSNATFSHCLCLDCLRRLYPDVAGEVEAQLTHSTPAPSPSNRPNA